MIPHLPYQDSTCSRCGELVVKPNKYNMRMQTPGGITDELCADCKYKRIIA